MGQLQCFYEEKIECVGSNVVADVDRGALITA